ncbi:MAG TPA: hypothetical protein VJN01_09435 [Xanthomonadales bacterium]|nr:hypothetical protein [Xanthomonadales bacterium]
MNAEHCSDPIEASELLDYWLDDLDAARAAEIEEHLFACRSCGKKLQALVELGQRVRQLVRDGQTSAVIAPGFVETLRDSGLRIREYRVEPNGSVNCTIAPHDDLVIARLAVVLDSVSRLDVLIDDSESGRSMRLEDVNFDPDGQEVTILTMSSGLRELGVTTQSMKLVAMDGHGNQLLGEYTFRHVPYRA